MRKVILAAALLRVAVPSFAAEVVDEVRQAESSFAKAFADRDQAKFFSSVADDATFLGAKQTLAGKDAVVRAWSQYFKGAAPFSWSPDRVVVNSTGDIGMTTGPVYDANGKHFADFLSVWQKQKDGTWKILFDGPGAPVCAAK